MSRGDLVTITPSGDYRKPRPALVVQADAFEAIPSVTVLPLTSEIHGEHLIRITLRPSRQNGPRATSQVMIDKAATVPRAKVGEVIGHAEAEALRAVSIALGRFLGLS
ncbi:MAG: type II toxin-antitoxin system PemK/MazF family toxin [Caulobacteraceae bacterium]